MLGESAGPKEEEERVSADVSCERDPDEGTGRRTDLAVAVRETAIEEVPQRLVLLDDVGRVRNDLEDRLNGRDALQAEVEQKFCCETGSSASAPAAYRVERV